MRRRVRRLSLLAVTAALVIPSFASSGAKAESLCVSVRVSLWGQQVFKTSPCVPCSPTMCALVDNPPAPPPSGGPVSRLPAQIVVRN
jgi:hypothetical protein